MSVSWVLKEGTEAMMNSINPATGEKIKSYDELTEKQISAKLDLAGETFEEWRKVPFAERSDKMAKAAQVLRDRKEEWATVMTQEMGKPITQARSEAEKCAWVCDDYAENAEKFLQDEIIETDASKSLVRYDPLGPVLAIMPWNFPFWQVFRFAAPGLMAGNVGLLKHASNVPGCALAIEEIFLEAGFPEGAFQTLLFSSSRADKVIADERVKAVTLTGSEPAGRKVAQTAGENLKKTVLELGGSDPVVILSDADVEEAAAVGSTARCINSGQSCIAAKRFIVVRKHLEEFTEKFINYMKQQKVGDPMEDDTQIGPMAREDLRDDLHNQVTQSIKDGAEVLLGGESLDRTGYFYATTVLGNVKKGMAVYEEETFGPVAAIIPAKDDDDAIRIANDTKFGLGAALWTKDLEKGYRLSGEVKAGCVFINGLVKSDPRLPFGGVKASGYGRELSYHGIREFVNTKTVWMK